MNRRTFIKSASALAVSLAIPYTDLLANINIADHEWIHIDPINRTINIISTASHTGPRITLLDLYSFLKEEWKKEAELTKYRFPMRAITPSNMNMINGYRMSDDSFKFLDGGSIVQIDEQNLGDEIWMCGYKLG